MTDIWVDACAVDDIDDEDLIRFDHGETPQKAFMPPTATVLMKKNIWSTALFRTP